MQSKEIVPGQSSANQASPSKADEPTCAPKHDPELVGIEVANVEGEIVLVHNEPKDGSAIEAASELHKLTGLLNEKSVELKGKADQAFLGTGQTDALAHSTTKVACDTNSPNAKILPSVVQEVVDDLCAEMKEIKPSQGQAVQNAAALDKVVEVLENKVEEIREKKIELTAHELNSLDGFDR